MTIASLQFYFPKKKLIVRIYIFLKMTGFCCNDNTYITSEFLLSLLSKEKKMFLRTSVFSENRNHQLTSYVIQQRKEARIHKSRESKQERYLKLQGNGVKKKDIQAEISIQCRKLEIIRSVYTSFHYDVHVQFTPPFIKN